MSCHIRLKSRTVERNGLTCLELTNIGGQTAIIPPPFPPYFLSPRKLAVGTNEGASDLIYLSDLQKHTLYRTSFPNVNRLRDCRVPDGIQDDMPYDQNVAIELQDGFNTKQAFPHPAIGAWDCEMESVNGKFDARFCRFTALSYVSAKQRQCWLLDDMPEYEMLNKLFDALDADNIDLPTTYFGDMADNPWLEQRCKFHNIPMRMGRKRNGYYVPPYHQVKKFNVGKKTGEDHIWDFYGRVDFDVFKEVIQDQSLFGIKNRQLKTVAEWFGIPVIRVDRARMATLSKEELFNYCLSDSNATYKLAEIYVRNLIPLTERLRISFNMTVNRSPSHVSNLTYFRAFQELGYVADKNNNERYPMFANNNGKTYQAALVDLFQPLFIEDKLAHVDFHSMYPNNMIAFNYCPTSILKVAFKNANLTPGRDYSACVRFPERGVIDVYDDVLKQWIRLTVDLSKDSISRTLLQDMMKERKDLKHKMEEALAAKNYDLAEMYNSQQWCVKVPMNSIPGYHGMGFARCGAFPIAAHITGEGRWEISLATNFVSAQNMMPIQRHTDGLWYKGDDISEELTRHIQDQIPDYYNKQGIGVGYETFTAGIFYETNGYILYDASKPKPRDLVYHSSGVKGRGIPKIADKCLDLVVRGIFAHDDVMGLLHSIKRHVMTDTTAEDFLTSMKIGRDDYTDTSAQAKIIKKAKAAGLELHFGDEIQIIQTQEYGAMCFGALLDKPFNIDYEYYFERIATLLERPLKVTHNLTYKQIYAALKGYIVTPPKPSTQTHFRRLGGHTYANFKQVGIRAYEELMEECTTY
jgi:DNA polymerase elongation subunit (family B)